MNYRVLANFYTWGVKLIIFAIPFLSLYIARSMFFPYITGRNFGFRILIEIALVLWLGLIFLKKEYRPKPSILLWALLGFVVIVGLANLFGVNPYYSFWSRYERMEGYVTILHLAAYFLMAGTVLKTKKDWQILFNIFIVVGLAIGVYALFQRLGYLRAIQGGQFRVDGTIGNPTYLAGYLLFILAFCAMSFAAVRARWAKISYAIAAGFTLLIIYFTASRGAILALGSTAVLLPLWYLFFVKTADSRGKFYKKITVGFLTLVVIVPIVFWFFRGIPLIKNNPTLGRLAAISLTEKTTRSRFMVWGMAWQGFKERPILGWGQENYSDVFAKYYNPKMYDEEPWFDRAHNIVFDWLINAGALGLLAYLSLFAAAFAAIWSAFRKGLVGATEAGVLFAALVAYFAQNLFVFDNFNTYILFFSLLAYIHSLERGMEARVAERKEDFNAIRERMDTSLVAAAAALILVAPIVYFANVRPVQESRALIHVLQFLSGSATPDQVSEQFKKTLSYNTFGNLEAREYLGRLALQLVDVTNMLPENKLVFIRFAVEEMEKQIAKSPDDLRTRLFLATLYNRAAALDSAYRDKAGIHIEAALKLSPTRQTIYFALADYYLLINDFVNALDALQKAVVLEPTYPEAQVNLGIIALNAGRDDLVKKAKDDILRLPKIHGGFLPKVVRFADTFIQFQKFESALELYEKIVALDPGVAQYRANLAGLYFKQGAKDRAREEALKAAELDPANFSAQVEEFLKNLK